MTTTFSIPLDKGEAVIGANFAGLREISKQSGEKHSKLALYMSFVTYNP